MIWLMASASILLIALDQWVKHWAVTYLQPVGEISLIDGLFGLIYVENQGAAFGLLQGGRWLFIPVTLIVTGVIAFYYIRLPRTREYLPVRIPMVFIFAGAIGNFIDRLLNGYVVDMFQFKFITFPIFNVADICLVVGTIVLAFILFFVIKDPA